MPSSVYIGGKVTYRPGVYHVVKIEDVVGGLAGYGAIAILGEFVRGGQPKTVYFAKKMTDIVNAFGKEVGFDIGQALFNAANDARIPNKPTVIYYVRVNPASRAYKILLDADGKPAVKVSAFDWGVIGNGVRVEHDKIEGSSPAAPGEFKALFVDPDDPFNEVVQKIATSGLDGNVATVSSTSDLSDHLPNTTKIRGFVLPFDGLPDDWYWGAARGLFVTGENTVATGATLEFPSGLSITKDILIKGLQTGDEVTITGKDADGGVFTATVGPNTDSGDEDYPNVRVEGCAVLETVDASNSAHNVTIEYCIAAVDDDGKQTMRDAQSVLQAAGIAMSIPSTRDIKKPLKDLDWDAPNVLVDEGNSFAGWGLTAEVASFVDAINDNISLVHAERLSNFGAGIPVPDDTVYSLSGGVDNLGADSTDWQEALDKLKDIRPLDVIVPLTGEASVWTLVKSHLEWRASTGHDPCLGVVGVDEVKTRPETLALSSAMNSRHVAIVPVQGKYYDYEGKTKVIPGYYMALRAAAMHVGAPIATPITHKYVNILDIIDGRSETDPLNKWHVIDDADDLIKAGLLFANQGPAGFRWERGVTSYIQDNNYVCAEISANESLNQSIKTMESFLDMKIGSPGTKALVSIVKGLVIQELTWQQKVDIIKGFLPDSIEIVDEGDRYSVGYTVAVIEPLNFITLQIYVSRNAGV